MTTVAPYAVLNCPVTEILGFYDTEEEATTAATEFGQCSFAYKLSPKEIAALDVMSRDVVLAPARNDTVPIQEVSVQTACH